MKSLLLLNAFLLAASASAQTVLFEDDFTNGLDQWTAETPWYWALPSDACVQQTSPDASFGHTARMGDPSIPDGCGFNSLRGIARLTMSQPVVIPSYADQPTLTFDSFVQTEACFHWDFSYLYISSDEGATWQYLRADCHTFSQWKSTSIDLSDWTGQSVMIRFDFNAVDPDNNDGLGWIIDNVKIETAPCSITNFCVAAPNSASATGARMGMLGTAAIGNNNFSLNLTDGPPGQFGFFYFGTLEMQFPWAGGFLCVGSDVNGLRRLYPGGQIDSSGTFTQHVDFNSLVGYQTILPGTHYKFQCWYRDYVNGQSTSNFSDGLAVTFCE